LQYVKDQTEAICIEAVKQNGYALMFVEIKSKKIHAVATAYKHEYASCIVADANF